jgi:hypothetical protein
MPEDDGRISGLVVAAHDLAKAAEVEARRNTWWNILRTIIVVVFVLITTGSWWSLWWSRVFGR